MPFFVVFAAAGRAVKAQQVLHPAALWYNKNQNISAGCRLEEEHAE
jgi:hypothetical protein